MTDAWPAQRSDLVRARAAAATGTSAAAHSRTSTTRGAGAPCRKSVVSSVDIAPSDRDIDELVGVRLRDLDALVVGFEFREHAPFLLGRARRHAAVSATHGKLLLEHIQILGKIRAADLTRN